MRFFWVNGPLEFRSVSCAVSPRGAALRRARLARRGLRAWFRFFRVAASRRVAVPAAVGLPVGGLRRAAAHGFGFELAARLDVDVPAAELAREPHVLALLADRERLLVLVDDDDRGVRVD